jgi:ATP-dependent Lon protease
MNPIIYFDELDKVSETSKGDEIIHFLTHITDLSQNSIYKDNYFPGVNIDLSKILFIFSFNDEHKIDKILKDRMQVIHTTGFKLEEKIEIANNYLIPEIYNNYKFTKDNVIIEEDILKIIINDYTKNEEGVRNLKRCLDMIVSKINMYYILYDEDKKSCYIDLSYKLEDFKLPYTLTEQDLKELLDSGLPETDKPPNYMYL